jgi:putative membrane protein
MPGALNLPSTHTKETIMTKHTLIFTAMAAAGLIMPSASANDAPDRLQTEVSAVQLAQAQTTRPEDKRGGTAATPDKGTGAKDMERTGGKEADKSQLGGFDKKFVKQAAEGGMKEVSLGQLAKEKATNDQVKKFGQHMVEDHTKANQELMKIAKSKNIDLPAKTESKDTKGMDKLRDLSGAQFDRQYMQEMVKDHEKTVKLFEQEAKEGKDPDLKAFAEKTLPTLREHLKMARSLSDQVGKGGGSAAGQTKSEMGKPDTPPRKTQ